MKDLEYVGFWPRVGATLIDTLLLVVIIIPLVTAIYGNQYWMSQELILGPMDFFLNYVFPAIAVIAFWQMKQATPGKMALSAKIVDAKTGQAPTTGQNITRYIAYWASAIPLMVGFIWVAFDPRKQGWHDKIAGTVVIRPQNNQPQPVNFQ